MVDLETAKIEEAPDRTRRAAALWATAVAVPVTLIVGLVVFFSLIPEKSDEPAKVPQAVPSTPVQVDAPRLDEATAQVCLAVTAQLPAKIRDLDARKVSAGPEQNAAYGEPPLLVSCGVPQPAMCTTLDDKTPGCVPMDTELLFMDGVCWFGKNDDGTAVLTTMDREVPVRVTVPSAYQNPAQWANEFSETVVKTVKSKPGNAMPSGCA
ncbi:hypothetical protein GCM10010112_03300 [Actinoplanes lobatus]|uniref:DUF3515 domain-containing protein n=1 Tax=Actinoplanes lobatus TaxID=113568 RepID=A0A7W7HAY2_9ACTN|nr:DUF3515 domain-containing protein [Actinoplanes lobatus]MBB4746752.1 hypothetical protein [Actinoplanes lobatus]GGN53973.1 hypothetical protein GCM10010112_03300 [Actinoplanes lobatus]GIE38818.1 hypothetical protein Alo02nite_17160 [Actinoplanes lobatus]